MSEYNILITNAFISEGTGKKEYLGSLGIKGDKVTATGEVKGDAFKTIDAKGLRALPGFIDAHSHSERNILWYPKCENYVLQGVTTFIGGQCGGSPAPLTDEISLPGLLSNYMMELAPYKYRPEKTTFPVEQVNEWMKERYGWTIDWDTMGEFFKRIEDTGVGVNYAPLVGHGTIRRNVMGKDYERDSTRQERARAHLIYLSLVHQSEI